MEKKKKNKDVCAVAICPSPNDANVQMKWFSDICAKRYLRERHLREVRLGEGERH